MIQALCEQWTRLAFMPLSFHGATNDPALMPGDIGVTPSAAAKAPRFLNRTFDSSQGSLAYKLYIPASFTGHDPTLVVMLHGCGQSADDFANGTDMNRHAEEAGCLVMYPEQTTFGMVGGCWNWFDKAHQQRGQGDAALIAGATREVMEAHGVPPGRVFVAGLSAGAAMAVVLGSAYPDIYAAVGCHSGLPLGCATDTATAMEAMRNGASTDQAAVLAQQAVPVIVFHGDNDQTVHSANGHTVVRHTLSATCANDALGTEVVKETGMLHGRDFTREVHRGPGGAVLAEHWVIHGAGHAWSGGSARGSYADEKGPSASAEMLRFFRNVGYAAAA